MANRYLTELELQVIKACLTAVYKTIRKSALVNSYDTQEYYIDNKEFDYNLLSDEAVKTLKKLVENY